MENQVTITVKGPFSIETFMAHSPDGTLESENRIVHILQTKRRERVPCGAGARDRY